MYSYLTIHQKITAKANALHYYTNQRAGKGLLARVSSKHPDLYSPNWPYYHIHVKTNDREP